MLVPTAGGGSRDSGVPSGCRLWLSEDLGGSDAHFTQDSCTSFEPGSLSGAGGGASGPGRGGDGSGARSFAIQALEVWGIGGADIARSQKAHKAGKAKIKEKMRQVDKAALFDSEFDRETFLGGILFAHAKQMEMRDETC